VQISRLGDKGQKKTPFTQFVDLKTQNEDLKAIKTADESLFICCVNTCDDF